MDSILEGAFSDPVLEAQSTFRGVMDALANPGTPRKVITPVLIGSSMTPELASIVLTLVDHDTSIWLDETLRADQGVLDFIGFHTGATVVAEPEKAGFAFVTGVDCLPPLHQFGLGTQEYPDRSTTVVLAVPALSGGVELITRGPGIRDHGHISPLGLPGDFVGQWAENRALFPRGVDLLLVADGSVMGLPRSTRISEGH